MGRIITSITITNVRDPSRTFRCDAMVDTGATFMVLPSAWKDRLGPLDLIEVLELQTADQTTIQGELCGPVELQIEGFRRIHTDVVFIEMEPVDGLYDPLIGYLVLEHSQAAVDMVRHRLFHVKTADLK